MKKLYIVANWKSNMTVEKASLWLHAIGPENGNLASDTKEIIICPPFTLLQTMQYKVNTFNSRIHIGSQDVSPFPEGAFTGEIATALVKEFCSYTLVGHSERRTHFHEDEAMINAKIEQSLTHNLVPILCVQDEKTPIPESVTLVAYEPVSAIGSGNPDSPDNANRVAEQIKKIHPQVTHVLYGGSVTDKNIHSFTTQPGIDGVLVGSASLDPEKFVAIVKNA